MQASTRHTQAHTQKESQAVNRIQMPLSSYFRSMVIRWLLHVYTQTLRRSCFVFLVSSKSPLWHHGECIGHLTHAPHVSEYISNAAISSQPLKHHVPHGAVWVGGLHIYQWISSLKCHLAFNTKPILYFMFKCQFFFFFPWCFMSFLSDCCRSKDSNLCAKISRFTFWSCWHAWHCPNTDLFDTASICMYALLTCALLTFATLTELKRSESLAC